MIGRILGNYRLVAKIGEGGMGAVYRAVDEMLDREVAIKAIRPDLAREPQIAERFRSEARLLARVQHPAIATIYSFFQAGENGDELFLAMEYVRGRTLAEVIASEGPMPYPRAVRLLGTAFEGIEQAHEAGIIHRDLKPDNLMLTDGERIKVMDFGIARLAGASHLTRTGLLVGTLRYMAPEQIRGEEVDRRTDVYALGIVLYQLLAGRVPFDGNTDYAILRAQLEDAPPPLRSLVPTLPAEVERAALRALAKDPAERFATVADLHRALKLSAHGASVETGVRPAPASDLDSTLPLPRTTAPTGAPAPGGAGSPATAASAATSVRPQATVRTPSAPTVETARTRARESAHAMPLPASGSTSYRPIERPGWKRAAAVALAVAVVAAGAFGLWRRLRPEPATGAPAVGTLTSDSASSDAAGEVPSLQQEPAPAVVAMPPASTPKPVLSARESANGPRTLPAQEGGSGLRPVQGSPAVAGPLPQATGTTTPAPAPSGAPPAAVEPPSSTPPAPPPAAAAGTPETQPQSDLPPLQELKRLASGLVEQGESLTEVYQTFLDQKEERGEDLSANDLALRDEIEALNEAAVRFDGFFNAGLLGRARNRLRRPNEGMTRLDLQRRTQALGARIGRVDQLLSAVNPSPEVRQAWSRFSGDWRRARQLLSA